MSGEASFVTLSGPAGEEEEEISPPADIKEGKDEAKQQSAKLIKKHNQVNFSSFFCIVHYHLLVT